MATTKITRAEARKLAAADPNHVHSYPLPRRVGGRDGILIFTCRTCGATTSR